MTNRSNRWLLVAAALLGVALLIPIVSAQGGPTSIATTDDPVQSSETAPHQGPLVDDRSAVTDSDRSGDRPLYHGHHQGPWVNGTYGSEWANETHAPYDSWVNSTHNGEWANETYGSHGPWTDESQDDVWMNETDEPVTRTGGHRRGLGGC